jgi:hypothetical protein
LGRPYLEKTHHKVKVLSSSPTTGKNKKNLKLLKQKRDKGKIMPLLLINQKV